MAIICPTITARSLEEYDIEFKKITNLCHRVQIDLTDGRFAPGPTVSAKEAWWLAGFKADFHLMYEEPAEAIKQILKHKPNLVIIHAESRADISQLADLCRHRNVKFGLALLPETGTPVAERHISKLDHVLIFSGNLGFQGGSHADLALLDKVVELKKADPALEIGWDGGVNDQNIADLVYGGVDVINVGSYIQEADDPGRAISNLQRIADETGET